MRRKDVKTIIAYFYGIPAQRRLLDQKRVELEEEYNGLRGTPYDGMPHSFTPGKPVEELVGRIDARNVREKLEMVAVRVHILETDREKIQDCLNAINGKYTRLILYRYRDKYSWVKTGEKLGITERTAKRWGERALERLGEALEEMPMPDEILGRASRARV
jgi:DNA-directed RNA polymerase specialized sigma24 family protein